MKIYFVRHPNYKNPENIFPYHLPVELADDGIAKIKRVGDWLINNNVHHVPIYTSPIKRCMQTAAIIQDAIGGEIIVDERLIETRCPNLQGTIKPDHDEWKVEEDAPTRESRTAIIERVKSFYEERLGSGKDCVAVSHGDQITHLYYLLTQKAFPTYIWSPDNSKNTIGRGEMLIVEIKGSALNLQRLNL